MYPLILVSEDSVQLTVMVASLEEMATTPSGLVEGAGENKTDYELTTIIILIN